MRRMLTIIVVTVAIILVLAAIALSVFNAWMANTRRPPKQQTPQGICDPVHIPVSPNR